MKKVLLFIALVQVLALNNGFAQPKIFTGTGDWTTAARWSGGTVPTSTQVVYIQGTCTISTAITRASTSETNIYNGTSLTISGTGSLTLNGTSVVNVENGTMSNAGTITVSAGTAISIYSDILNSFSNSGTIQNSGNIYLFPGNNGNNTFTNTGTINNNSGGAISGIGTINSTSITNPSGGIVGGYYDYSNSLGFPTHDCVTFSNNLVNNGIVKFSMVNTGTACTDFNRIAVSGQVTFGGTFTASGTATSGTYTLMTYGSRNGTTRFTNSTAPLGNGRHLNIAAANYGATSLTATVSATPLGIELLSFDVNTEGGKNKLAWTTASEINNSHIDIERSTDGTTFHNIGQVKGNNKPSSYQYVDASPFTMSYYRLKQVDFDGTETLSKVVSIAQQGKGKGLKVYPTLVSGSVLTVDTEGGQLRDFSITNLLGQQVLAGKTQQQIDVSRLSQGTYVLKVGTEVAKFVKQ
jgi:hypothetical protein